MLLRIQTITTLFAITLFSGCFGCAQESALKGIEPQDDYSN